MGSLPGGIRRFDIAARTELPPLRGHTSRVTGMHPTPDGRRLVSAGWDGRVRRFDLESGTELPAPDGYDHRLALAASPDGTRFVLGGWNGRLDVFDPAGRQVRTIQSAGPHLLHLTYTPDGRSLVAHDLSGKLRFFDAGDWSEHAPFDLRLPTDDGYIFRPAFSSDGRRLLTGTHRIGLVCWDLPTRTEVWRQPNRELGKNPNLAVFSPDDAHVLSGGWDKAITWRYPQTGEVRRTAAVGDVGHGDSAHVNRITFAPDGRTFLTAHHDATIRRWDIDTGKQVAVLKGHVEVVWWARFSPDGKWIASGSVDRTVRIWEAATGTEVCRLTDHDHWVGDGAWLSGGRAFVSTGGPEALLWDLRPADLDPADPAHLWDALAADPVTAYRAQWALLDDPKAALALLRERLPIAETGNDAAAIRQLIANLDSPAYRTRERAARKLREAGPAALLHLRAAQATASPEARRRIDELLAGIRPVYSPADLRMMRAVQVLELAGTPEAVALLREWASNPAGTRLAAEAAESLGRLRP
jgi:WD40 repeat protein